MRITPENSLLQEAVLDEIDYEKIWEEDFPIKRGEGTRARQINALWAALTERGRLVGVQVHDWTIGDVKPVGSGSGLGSEGNEWNFPINGMVRPNDEIYWDGFKNEGDSDPQSADLMEGSAINDLLDQIHIVCQCYVNPDEGHGFLGLGDLMGYLKIGKLESEDEDGNTIHDQANWPFDAFSGIDHDYDAWSFPTLPDRTTEAADNRQDEIEQEATEEAEATEEEVPEGETSQEKTAREAEEKKDRFWYARRDPTPGATRGKQTIEINDPRFTSAPGGGFGPAQYLQWDFFGPLGGQDTVPAEINVKISSNLHGEDPEDDDETLSVPLPPFHEHINACYYMIRALEWLPYKTSDTTTHFKELTLRNDGGRTRIIGKLVCEVTQNPAGAFKDQWMQFVNQRIPLPLQNPIVFVGSSATLFASAIQETWFSCPVFGPLGPQIWVAQNIKQARFSSYVPLCKPWESDYEQEEFPGGFPASYKVEILKIWHEGATGSSQATADGTSAAQNGWGGDSLLMLEEGEIGSLTGDGDFFSGEQIDKIGTDFGDFEISEEVTVATPLPNTVAALESDDPAFNLHYNLDPGKFRQVNSPNNQPPRVESPDAGITQKNITQSSIVDDVRVATKFEEHTYPGGRVSFSDMEL